MTPRVPPLSIDVDADPGQLAVIRQRLSQWLTLVGVPSYLSADILLVVNEACSNSIEHGYANCHPGVVRLSGDVAAEGIWISVEDFGQWRTNVSGADIARGRGLPLMRVMSDGLNVHTSAEGTRVTMTFPMP